MIPIILDGYIIELFYCMVWNVVGPVVVYATMYGSIVGWDLRQPGTAWKLDNDLKHGMISSVPCLK